MKPTSTPRLFRRRRHKNNTQSFLQPVHQEQGKDGEGNKTFLTEGEPGKSPLPFITPAHDISEQQAEEVSEQVVRGSPVTSRLSSQQSGVQRKEIEKEDISKKPEEPEEIKRKTEEEQMNRMPSDKAVDKMADEEERIATKTEGGGTPAVSQGFANNLKNTKGKGSPLGHNAQTEMSGAFGVDFSNVRIHTGKQAEQLSGGIHAQAFTHGKDIYFNTGKYNPGTPQGKKLLAHELTHVVQQSKVGEVKRLQREQIPGISTPAPKGFSQVKNKQSQVVKAEGIVAGVSVTIHRDTSGALEKGLDGKTGVNLRWTTPGFDSNKGIITKVHGPANVTLSIKTTYRKGVDPAVASSYGRGTTKADKAAGNTSLRFHEGSHGTFAINYLQSNPLPKFTGTAVMPVADFKKAVAYFNQAMTSYNAKMQQANIQATDCSGSPGSICTP